MLEHRGGLRLLQVEDSAADAELIQRSLRAGGAALDCLVTDALEQVRQALRSESWDAVLSDYQLHDFTAIDVLHAVSELSPGVPLVLVTGALRDVDALRCIHEGATDYVLKDNLVRLPLVLERVLREADLRAEREAAAEAWHQSETEYRLLFESSPEPMYVFDPADLRFLAVNAAAMTLYGYTSAELLTRSLPDIVPPAVAPSLKAQIENVDGRITPAHGAVEQRRKDGSPLWVELHSSPITFAGRRAQLVLVRDVSDRVRAQAAQREAEAGFEQLVQTSPHGIYHSRPDEDRFLTVNPALVQLLGYESSAEVLQLSLSDDVYCCPGERAHLVADFVRDPHQMVETRWKRKDGTALLVALHVQAVYRPDGSIDHFHTVVEDLTEKRHLEDQLRQAQKMEAIGQLAGGIAHDFNNLLMVIRGYSEIMETRLPADSPLRNNLQKVLDACDRAANLIRKLLAFSRKQVLQPRVLDLNAIVRELGKLLSPLIGEDIELHLDLAADLGRVRTDPGQLEQVLMNLASNARDAMPHGGKLTIATRNTTVDAIFARRHPGMAAGDYVVLSVTDNGCGMDRDTLAHVFEPFFTTKANGKGTGLGLSTVYGIVNQSGGQVSAYSEPGRGTSFKIYLPCVQEVATAEAPAPAVSSAHGSERVLIVEDEEGVRESVREYLESLGYVVAEAANGAEALQLCDREPPDLLITDMIMPLMGGQELVRRLQLVHPEMRVLFISGYSGSAIDHQGELGEDAAFLEKPFTWKALGEKVRAVLDAKVPAAART